MIKAMVSGRLYEAPTRRETKKGQPMVSAKVIADGRGTERGQWVNVVGFSESVCRALLACGPDDPVALTGDLTVRTYQDQQGATRASVDLLAHGVLTMQSAHEPRRPRKGREPGDDDEEYEGQLRNGSGQEPPADEYGDPGRF